MDVPFLKMHGAGNDFVVIDERARPLDLSAEQVRRLADRRLGIGCDQFITLHPPPPGTDADLVMRIRNPDGGEAGACGNATRCVAELLFEQTGHPFQVIRTIAGDLPAERLRDGRFRVDMGPARLRWDEVPLAREIDTLHLPLPGDPAACGMGNPHATLFVPDVAVAGRDGPALEHDPLFPERANIGFATMIDRGRMRLRVWERGAGLTLACGSGACAAAVNAHRRGLAERQVAVEMDGGVLEIAWREDGHVLMAGPAATAFRGQITL
jgi:diaminopimelate epimerase